MDRPPLTLKDSLSYLAEGHWTGLIEKETCGRAIQQHLLLQGTPNKHIWLREMKVNNLTFIIKSTCYLATKLSLSFQPSLVDKCLLLLFHSFSPSLFLLKETYKSNHPRNLGLISFSTLSSQETVERVLWK